MKNKHTTQKNHLVFKLAKLEKAIIAFFNKIWKSSKLLLSLLC